MYQRTALLVVSLITLGLTGCQSLTKQNTSERPTIYQLEPHTQVVPAEPPAQVIKQSVNTP
ncbi:hypothetical protein ACGTJS_06635 [Faucicola mancuniensis]|uniref:hypothetical protein n=1 Tax=Faucicola mancuniensis TaxID=1309795 RepID=UPI0039772ACA